jgi:hypothetical protein
MSEYRHMTINPCQMVDKKVVEQISVRKEGSRVNGTWIIYDRGLIDRGT